MGIDTPLRMEVLVGLGALTAVVVAALVRYMLTSKSLGRHPSRLHQSVLLLFFSAIAAVMSFMLWNALAYGEAYGIGRGDAGKLYRVSQDPVSYWILVAVYYGLAVPALSVGLVVAARFLQPLRPRSSPHQPFERLSAYAAIVYIAGVLIALYVYWSRDWAVPPRHRIAAVLLAPVFVFFGLLAVYTGEQGGSPARFWARATVMLLLGVGLLLIGIGVIPT